MKWIIERVSNSNITCKCPRCGYTTDRQALNFRHCPMCGVSLIENKTYGVPKGVSIGSSCHYCGNCWYYRKDGMCMNVLSEHCAGKCVWSFTCGEWVLKQDETL